MNMYIFAQRPKKDQTLMSVEKVRSLGKNSHEYRVGKVFLEAHPELKAIFNRKAELKALGKKICETGSGGSASKWKDRFGYTEKDFLATIEGMRKDGMLTRKDTIRAAQKTIKSTGRIKRQYLNEVLSFNPHEKSTDESISKVPVRKLPEKKHTDIRAPHTSMVPEIGAARFMTMSTYRGAASPNGKSGQGRGSSIHTSMPSLHKPFMKPKSMIDKVIEERSDGRPRPMIAPGHGLSNHSIASGPDGVGPDFNIPHR